MKNEIHAKKAQRSFGTLLFWAVGILLTLTMLSVWLVCGLFAKYVTTDDDKDIARVAGTGVVQFDVWEHEAENKSDEDATVVYVLNEDELVKDNTYDTVLPGYDIPKDPFVRLELKDPEVDYYLYLRVIKSDDFPSTVTFDLTEEWEEIEAGSGYYKYTGYFDARTDYKKDIFILENNELIVSDKYKGEYFFLTFEAELKQVD